MLIGRDIDDRFSIVTQKLVRTYHSPARGAHKFVRWKKMIFLVQQEPHLVFMR
jgi:hypothetical protein